MKKLNWSKLKDFKCPKCGHYMTTLNSGSTRAVGCEDEDNCGFWMSDPVFNRIVKNLYQTKPGYRPKFGDDMENLTLLEELNRGIVPKDYQEHVFLEPEEI